MRDKHMEAVKKGESGDSRALRCKEHIAQPSKKQTQQTQIRQLANIGEGTGEWLLATFHLIPPCQREYQKSQIKYEELTSKKI